ncbi:MAG: prepilin-type N-terminal cleavage/methylation domain-containing protein [Gammaproteobacteria bacterium]|nr:prepilin-type N-terminal cleavage/methylation domain-containing protein [Gammaproteobacteria bacterium]MDH3534683.1 prepilin-type N-terminal cleavage/methylation domain-containing protein [Gammaproteobacteria bacterium]
MQYSKQKGFTLVEIAIVLVIVGLLIGGVLKGQEMITNAKLKRIESDNAGIAAAMFSYQDRYLQLPGDDSGAEDRFTVYAAGDPVNGDGSGTIDGLWNVASTGDITLALTAETNMFFAHLRAAGLIPGGGVDDTKPTNAYGGQIGIQDGALNMSGHVTIFGTIEGPIAKIIEARLDDDAGDTGRVQSAISGADMTLPASAAAVYDDAQRYDMAFRL